MRYTAQQVRAKARAAYKRREDEVEEEETESGEINLIPYLDIVTNLMLFLLVSVSTGTLLGQINISLPEQTATPSSTTPPPQVTPEEQPLQLVLTVLNDRVELWSMSGLEGTNLKPRNIFNRTGRNGEACDGNYMCESSYCTPKVRTCDANPDATVGLVPVFDYRAINTELFNIAKLHYDGKQRGEKTYSAILMADGTIPYGTIISMMSTMRCPMPKFGENGLPCLMPSYDEDLKKAENPVSLDSMVYDPLRATYDVKTMAYFPDILFSPGIR